MTTLLAIGRSGLYGPDSGEPFAFLLWSQPPEPVDSFPLEQTWSPDGPAVRVGYHVFLEGAPSGSEAEMLATALRGGLPQDPVTTGFAWAASPPKQFTLLGAVAVTIAGSRPVVAADAPIAVEAPMPALTVPQGLVIEAHPGLAGWTLTDPRGQPGLGLDVPLLGPACGDISFRGLLASPVGGDATVKPLARVRIDPLHPFDPGRTEIVPLGAEYRVSEAPAGSYHIAPVQP
jgi:hypothetical protein